MSRVVHSHILRSRTPKEYDIWEPGMSGKTGAVEIDDELVAWCGDVTRGKWDEKRPRFIAEDAAEARHVSCPVCNSRVAAKRLKARPADAPVLTLVQDKEARGYFRSKGAWQALQDGVQIAFLAFENHGWRVYPLTLTAKDEVHAGMPLDKDGSPGRRDYNFRLYAAEYKSKEEALLGAETFRAGGFLLTADELRADRTATAEANRIAREDRDRRVAEKEEVRNDTLTALREILETETLSNFQRQGLMTAIAKFEKPTERFSLDD